MSRSYKHTSFCGGTNKFFKKYANRRVRRKKMDLILPKGSYRKVSDSWQIKDYFDLREWENYWYLINDNYFWKRNVYLKYGLSIPEEPNYNKSHHRWRKTYKMK